MINVEAEQQILGAILTNNAVFDRVGDVLKPEHFGDPVHARIFEAAGQRIAKGHLASPVSMRMVMEGDEGLKALGGPAYLARLVGFSPPVAAVAHYAKDVIEAAARRALRQIAQDGDAMLSEGRDSAEVKAALLRALQSIPEPVGEESSYSLLRTVKDAIDETVRAYKGEVSLLRTGLGPLDQIIKGLAPGDLMLLAGATSMGKTALALEVASNCAYRGDGVVFVSLEMTREQLANRMISTKARIPYTKTRDAHSMTEDEMRKWVESSMDVSKGDMRIVPKHIRDVPGIYAAAKRSGLDFRTGKPSLVVVDYAQLVRGQGKGRYEQMTDVSISLKHLGGLLECPVMALVQLSRDIGTRDDKRPQLFDIKETGQFENDADQVAMCHREEYWLARQGPRPDKKGDISAQSKADWEADLAAVKNKMEILVRKNRHGRVAVAEVGFHDATNRFWVLGQEQGEDFR